MTLDERDLRNGLKFIVGTWRPDFIVSLFSNNLEHIPASEFKDGDGATFESLSFEFFEDHTVRLTDTSKKVDETGTWEQKDLLTYRYHLDKFDGIPEGPFKDAAEELSIENGHLAFAIGFLVIAMKKTAEGVVTEEKKTDVGDAEPSEADLAMNDIVGTYAVCEAMSMVDGKFGTFTKEQVEADVKKRVAAGDMDEETAAECLSSFSMMIEFTEDHKVLWWRPLPAGVSEEMIQKALEAGEIAGVKDGMFSSGGKEWKAVDGKYYYDTGEHREVFGEVQSSWDELVPDENGAIPMSGGMMKIKKI
jgi:hypothetical protein